MKRFIEIDEGEVEVIPNDGCVTQHHLVVCDFTVRIPPVKSVPRSVLWWALLSAGVEEWVVRVIHGMYVNARSRVRVNDQLTQEWE